MLRIPDNQEDVDDDVSNLLIGKYMDTYVNRRQLFRQNKAILYSVVLRQWTQAMKNRLEGEGSFEHIDKYSDVIKLLNIINSISYSYKSKPHPFLSVHQPMKAFYASYQQTTMSYDSYMEPITNLRDAIVHCGGSMGYHPFLVN